MAEFVTCLFILSDRNLYEFVQLNLPGLLPNLTVIKELIDSTDTNIQGEFRYDAMFDYLSPKSSKFTFSAEDCTSVVLKMTYIPQVNNFIGFVPPLRNGMPQMSTFTTESFTELENCSTTLSLSHHLNVHIIQPITLDFDMCSSFLLSAYGTANQFTTKDVIARRLKIADECEKTGTRLVGFSTDANSHYLRSIRLLTRFCAHLPNQQFHLHENAFSAGAPRVSSILCIVIWHISCTNLPYRLGHSF